VGWCTFLPAAPVYIDYGTTVVYQGDTVYVNGDAAASATEYAQQATTLAETGKQAAAPETEEWEPLGVFAMVQGDEKSSYNIFHLAINKKGILRGNYYNALADPTEPIYGSVDPKTQRAAWTVGNKKEPVYETGIANLTQQQTAMLVHFSPDRTGQF